MQTRSNALSLLTQPGVHEKHLHTTFPQGCQFDGVEPVFEYPLYCIAFTNRSGSNLLAEYLRDTPVFSGFREQLNVGAVKSVARSWELTRFPELFARIDREAEGKIYGFKASVDQLAMLWRMGIQRMYRGGLRIIQIEREDVLGQAISYQIALQTKAWTSRMKSECPEAEVEFNPEQISRLIEGIQRSGTATDLFVEIFDVPRLRVTYEELTHAPQAVLDRIAVFADQDAGGWTPAQPKITRQAGPINDKFRSAYRDYVASKVLR